MYMWHGPGMAPFGGMGIFMFLWIPFVIVGVFLLIRLAGRPHRWDRRGHGMGSARALDILKERYARGEIDAETYQRMKEELQ